MHSFLFTAVPIGFMVFAWLSFRDQSPMMSIVCLLLANMWFAVGTLKSYIERRILTIAEDAVKEARTKDQEDVQEE